MQRLIIAFLTLNLMLSCRSVVPSGSQKISTKTAIFFYSPYFTDAAKDYVFKASIDAYSRSFGGILIIKKISPITHRVVMTTEFGNRVFDFEISEEQGFKKNYILEALDKKPILALLKTDFSLLVNNKFKYFDKYTNIDKEYLTTELNKQKVHITLEKGQLTAYRILKNRRPYLNIHFDASAGDFPTKVLLDHSTRKLRIKLTPFTD